MGEMLRTARHQAGLTLEAASGATRIPRHNLIALETDNLDALPAEPFTRGLIRIYARYLAVPDEPVLNAYGAALGARRYAAAEPGRALRRRRGLVAAVATATIVLLAVAVLLVVIAGGQPATGGSVASGRPTAPGPSGLKAGSVLELFAVRSTEVSVVVDGQPQFEGSLTEGSSRTWSPQREIAVRAEAADAIEVRVDGSSIGFLGPPGGAFQRTWRVDAGG